MAGVEVRRAVAEPIAAVRRRIPKEAIGASWGPALDRVWQYLRASPGLHTSSL